MPPLERRSPLLVDRDQHAVVEHPDGVLSGTACLSWSELAHHDDDSDEADDTAGDLEDVVGARAALHVDEVGP